MEIFDREHLSTERLTEVANKRALDRRYGALDQGQTTYLDISHTDKFTECWTARSAETKNSVVDI